MCLRPRACTASIAISFACLRATLAIGRVAAGDSDDLPGRSSQVRLCAQTFSFREKDKIITTYLAPRMCFSSSAADGACIVGHRQFCHGRLRMTLSPMIRNFSGGTRRPGVDDSRMSEVTAVPPNSRIRRATHDSPNLPVNSTSAKKK